MASDTDTIVVVGGGLSAARLATEYRAAGGEAPVTILSNEQDPPYHRPPLTKGFLRDEVEREGTYVRPAEEYEDEVVELRLESTVERIDPDAHVVVLEGGEEVPYGTLVLALLRATGVLCVYGSGFGTAPEDGFFRVVFLAPPAARLTARLFFGAPSRAASSSTACSPVR